MVTNYAEFQLTHSENYGFEGQYSHMQRNNAACSIVKPLIQSRLNNF